MSLLHHYPLVFLNGRVNLFFETRPRACQEWEQESRFVSLCCKGKHKQKKEKKRPPRLSSVIHSEYPPCFITAIFRPTHISSQGQPGTAGLAGLSIRTRYRFALIDFYIIGKSTARFFSDASDDATTFAHLSFTDLFLSLFQQSWLERQA